LKKIKRPDCDSHPEFDEIALDPDCRRILKYSRLCLENLHIDGETMVAAQNQSVNESMIPRNPPQHVAIIMDGNRRWARRNLLATALGHQAGADAVEKIVEKAIDLGIQVLTLFAFSTENWKRGAYEIDWLFHIFENQLIKMSKALEQQGVCLRTIGQLSLLPQSLQEVIASVKKQTAMNKKLQLVLAFNYGARDELVRAVQKIIEEVKVGCLTIDGVDEEQISRSLDTSGLVDPDLVIRTSGENRMSNFLLWQSAYSEFYTCDVLWPDFSPDDLDAAVHEYCRRQRRKGV
jgi:undecaprenyl diphosphate synthase